jgi:hypothetical protein
MVHALQRAGRRLRRGGTLISLRPHPTWRPLISISTRGQGLPVARLINPNFDRYLQATEAALERVVRDGEFRLAGAATKRYRIRLDNLSQLRTYLELINPPRPRFPAGERARLVALWQAAPRRARIEVTESMVVNALTKPS